MHSDKARVFEMFVGWVMAFYGVRRRDWTGTITAMAGLILAALFDVAWAADSLAALAAVILFP